MAPYCPMHNWVLDPNTGYETCSFCDERRPFQPMSARSASKSAARSVVQIRVEPELRRQFEALCESRNTTVSLALRAFMKDAVSKGRVPGQIDLEEWLGSKPAKK